jgi:hypothetical protein
MSASPTSKRQQPERKFEDYVLTYEVGPGAGLFPIADAQMSYVTESGQPSFYPVGGQGEDDGNSFVDLGFDLLFEDKSYRKVYVDSNGYCILIEPGFDVSGFNPSTECGAGSDNTGIKDVFAHNHLMLAPWNDDLRNCWRSLDGKNSSGTEALYYLFNLGLISHGYSGGLTDQDKIVVQSLAQGLSVMPPGIESAIGGVKIYRGNSSNGSYVLLRWKSFAYWTDPINIVKFDVVLYENGVIEIRYSPKITGGRVSQEGATMGIFCYGGRTGFPRYRDLAPYIKNNAGDSRTRSINGGYPYDGSYTDAPAKYTVSLNVYDNWPGQAEFGAVFRLSPPRIRRRSNRSIVTLRDSQSFLRTSDSLDSSFFDDQKSLPFTVQNVEYPSMVPSSYKTSGNSSLPESITELYQSGSIVVNRQFNSGLYESILQDSVLESSKRRGR